jgi:hypothetical protein
MNKDTLVDVIGSIIVIDMTKLDRTLYAFIRGAEKYNAKNGRPPVLIIDSINILGKHNPNLLHWLQSIAKKYADEQTFIIVFVSSEGNAPRSMMGGYCVISPTLHLC